MLPANLLGGSALTQPEASVSLLNPCSLNFLYPQGF